MDGDHLMTVPSIICFTGLGFRSFPMAAGCLVRGLYSHFEKVATIVGLVVVHFSDQGWWRLDASGFGSRKSLGR